ncbi:MAG TPA: lysophospholipid acyltransferase family protein [Tepidisphaeraceae bacterium]
MRDRIELEQMPRFWEPKPSKFWEMMLGPVHRWTMHRTFEIAQVEFEAMDRLARIDPKDGILLCPNHSYTGDGAVALELSRRAPRRVYVMAAWHVFRTKFGVKGWLLQRQGCFSVDREGCDRRAIKQAVELLTTGKALCIFPEGEIYHTNERLTPLREGVAFIAATAQRDLDKRAAIPSPGTPAFGSEAQARRGEGQGGGSVATVWLVPVGVRYHFIGNVMPALESAMTELERRVLLTTKVGQPLHERIIRFGEVALTIKEKDHLGHEGSGDLPTRINALAQHVLAKREQMHLGKANPDEAIPVRVKLLRQHFLESVWEKEPDEATMRTAFEGLGDVQLALQLYSYPGDYISQKPSVERMAETIEKFEEDVYGTYATPKGRRRALVRIGEPISVREHMGAGKMRAIASALTSKLESGIRAAMNADAPPSAGPAEAWRA